MISIFEQLDAILKSINENADEEVTIKLPPINPDMETADQGTSMALEKIAMYFYKLSMEGGGSGMQRNDAIDLPDDWLSPVLKGKLDQFKDKTFDKNKVMWDKEELEKLKKEIELNVSGDSDDEFDDFDYRDNDFGDDDADTSDLENNADGGGGGSSSQSEQDRLQDAINDAIDKLRSDRGMDNQDSGNQQGGQQNGQQGGQQQSGNQQGGQQSGQQGGQQGGNQQGGQQNGGQQGGQQQNGGQNDDGHGGGGTSITSSKGGHGTERDRMLDDLKDAIGRGDSDGVESISDKIKEGEDGSGNLAGENIGNVSDETLKDDMKKAGISDKDIDEMSEMKNDDSLDDMNDEDIRDLKREVIKGLEKKCEKRGGSALAKTIVRNALKAKIDDNEWRNMLKLFLKSKSIKNGKMAETENDVKYGHKNHLWRDAVLPTTTVGQGQIQNIYCIVDFSGSVNKDLVFTFLGKVIDLCAELNYTNVVVYGLGSNKISLPTEITARMLKTKGKDVVLSQTWDFIDSQKLSSSGTDFAYAVPEILEIRKRQRDAVFLVFGDAYWDASETLPLRDKLGERICDRICMLLYYRQDRIKEFASYVAILKELVGLKNIITTKASSINPTANA